MAVDKCGICLENDAKYKCPKSCVRYCSLARYKELQKRKDLETNEAPEKAGKNVESAVEISSSTDSINEELPLATPSLNQIYEESPELKELLQFNTVKFHLTKVHRILSTELTDGNDSMSSDMKNQLAIDYLNTLRYGGIHYNEAIEEFCQIYLNKVDAYI